MPDPVTKFFDFSGGYIDRRVNPLNYPHNGISAGEDVSIQNRGVRTRPGKTMTSTGSLPAGEVMVTKQVRFPRTGEKYTLAQVKGHRTGWLASVSNASAPALITAVCWDESRGDLWCMGDTGTNYIHRWNYDTDKWTATTTAVPAEGYIGYDAVNDQIIMIKDVTH